MGALNRVKKDQHGNMMMPHNVAGSNYEEGASVVQAIAAGVLLVSTILLVIWYKDTRPGQSLFGWVIFILLWAFVAQLIIRYIIFNEKYLMKQTALIQKATNKAPADTWNVINIDDEGVIYYQDGRVGLIIEAEQATVVGRNEDFRHTHYSALSDFYKTLNQENINWTHINAMINAKQENRLTRIGEDLQGCKNSAIKQMCEMHLAHMRNLEIRTLYEREYWALIARPIIGREHLLEAAYAAAENLENAAFNSYNILNKEQCYQLNVELQALSSFDANALMLEKAQTVAGAPIAKLIELKVETGHITERNENIIKKSLKAFGDKSSFTKPADRISTFTIGEKLGNIVTQRLQYFIRSKRSLNDGELLSNIMNIKLVNSSNSVQETEKESVETTIEAGQAFMFSEDTLTAEEYAAELQAEANQVSKLNKQMFSEAELQAIEERNAKKLTAEEKKRQAAEKLKEQQEAAQALKKEEEQKIKARVNFDDFSED